MVILEMKIWRRKVRKASDIHAHPWLEPSSISDIKAGFFALIVERKTAAEVKHAVKRFSVIQY